MCYFAAMEGVCDTPLHLFGYFMGNTMVERCAASLPWREYAIRPYTCSVISWVMRWLNGVFFPAMEGVCDTPLHLLDGERNIYS